MIKLGNVLFEAAIDAWTKKHHPSSEQLENAKIIFQDLQTKYQSFIDPSAKNLVSFSYDRLKFLHEVILLAAHVHNLSAQSVRWLTKQIANRIYGGKDVSIRLIEEDFIPPLKKYQQLPKDIKKQLEEFDSITELNYFLADVVNDSSLELASEDELGFLGEKNGWRLYMPHTTAASCELGKTNGKSDTTWCTARTDKSNLFLNYTFRSAKQEKIKLYYVIKTGINASKNPKAKMSIGVLDGEIVFDTGDGGLTVDADNNSLTEKQFRNIVGNDTADYFLSIIEKDKENEHPSIIEVRSLMQDVEKFRKKLSSFKDEDLKEDFIINVLKVFQDENIPIDILELFAENATSRIAVFLLGIKKLPDNLKLKLAKHEDLDIVRQVAYHNNLPKETLLYLANYPYHEIRRIIAAREDIPASIIVKLSKDPDRNVAYTATINPAYPSSRIDYISSDAWQNPDILPKIVKYADLEQKKKIAKNSNTSLQVLMQLAKTTQDRELLDLIISHPKMTNRLKNVLDKEHNLYEAKLNHILFEQDETTIDLPTDEEIFEFILSELPDITIKTSRKNMIFFKLFDVGLGLLINDFYGSDSGIQIKLFEERSHTKLIEKFIKLYKGQSLHNNEELKVLIREIITAVSRFKEKKVRDFNNLVEELSSSNYKRITLQNLDKDKLRFEVKLKNGDSALIDLNQGYISYNTYEDGGSDSISLEKENIVSLIVGRLKQKLLIS